MICALTVRKLKPGAFEEFRQLFEGAEQPPGWTRAYVVRNLDDEDEVISFGFFDGTLDELRGSQVEGDYRGWREQVDALVESTGTDGLYEVAVELAGV